MAAQHGDGVTALLLFGALLVVAYRRMIAYYAFWTLEVLLLVSLLLGSTR